MQRRAAVLRISVSCESGRRARATMNAAARANRNVATATTGSRPTRVSRLPRARRRASASATAANTKPLASPLERNDDGVHESGLRPERQERVGRAIGPATGVRGGYRELLDQQRAREEEHADGGRRGAEEKLVRTGPQPAGRVREDDVHEHHLRHPGRDPARAVEHAVRGLRQQRRRPQEAAQHQQPAEPAGRRGRRVERIETRRDRGGDHQRVHDRGDPARLGSGARERHGYGGGRQRQPGRGEPGQGRDGRSCLGRDQRSSVAGSAPDAS